MSEAIHNYFKVVKTRLYKNRK